MARVLVIAFATVLGITAGCSESVSPVDTSRPAAAAREREDARRTREEQLAHYDLSSPTMDMDEVHSGGPPMDGIPSLTDPVRVAVAQAEYPGPASRVIVVEAGGVAVAYPIGILNYHEAVNDVIGDALPPKTLGLGVRQGDYRAFVTADSLQGRRVKLHTPGGIVEMSAAGRVLGVHVVPPDTKVVQTFYHAWSAFYPDTQVVKD